MAKDKDKPVPPNKPVDVPKGPPVQTEGGGNGDPPKCPDGNCGPP